MASMQNIGPKRLVVGAHYGLKDFIVQRITAIVLAIYTLVFLVGLLLMPSFTYASWQALFTFKVLHIPLGQVSATLAFIALAWHAWIGVRDIWMDYIKPVSVRLVLQVLTVLWLLGSVMYFVRILWSL